MGGEMRKVGMKFPPQVLDELSCRAFDVSDQGVTPRLHISGKIIPRGAGVAAGLRDGPVHNIFAGAVSGGEGREFLIYNQRSRGVAQPGSAPALGAQKPALKALLFLTAFPKKQ